MDPEAGDEDLEEYRSSSSHFSVPVRLGIGFVLADWIDLMASNWQCLVQGCLRYLDWSCHRYLKSILASKLLPDFFPNSRSKFTLGQKPTFKNQKLQRIWCLKYVNFVKNEILKMWFMDQMWIFAPMWLWEISYLRHVCKAEVWREGSQEFLLVARTSSSMAWRGKVTIRRSNDSIVSK